ncbi:beta-1,4 N-acetylgalactosaminyltransferase 2-like [Brachyhypopomus gauderio]|uniref:beta-1,4 N-acetylgalactosaminyltransferase 2-like n=1 Tax=Brachyhypopomus gauderio TaxID=698409 RepID=UPI0040434054
MKNWSTSLSPLSTQTFRLLSTMLRNKLLLIVSMVIVIIFIFFGPRKNVKSIYQWRSNSGPTEYTNFPKPRLFLNVSRPPCKCEADRLIGHVPKDVLSLVEKRRSQEYSKHQTRTITNLDHIILAPANSPLQYPIHGLTVTPMKKSLIPGLALHAQKRSQYKVSLSVDRGVLSVDNDLEGVQVAGQDQSKISLSSSHLDHLNHLLSTVMYKTSVYHIRTSDTVHFSFEDYEALFPITIRRPSIPVLYDPGKDINSQVTVVTKTFLRYTELKILIGSIRQFYPDIKIIVADDSLVPENVTGTHIEHYIMPPAQGWFAGRNLAVSQVTSKYFLWVDDDFVFLNKTHIEKFVEVMEAVPDLDVIGGDVDGNQFYFSLMYEEGDEEGGCMRRVHGHTHSPLPGFDGCYLVDGVVNFFLARTDAVRKVGFDPFLKRVAHTEFFIDGLGELMVATCKGFSVGHQQRIFRKDYSQYRIQTGSSNEEKLAHHFFKNHLKCIKY